MVQWKIDVSPIVETPFTYPAIFRWSMIMGVSESPPRFLTVKNQHKNRPSLKRGKHEMKFEPTMGFGTQLWSRVPLLFCGFFADDIGSWVFSPLVKTWRKLGSIRSTWVSVSAQKKKVSIDFKYAKHGYIKFQDTLMVSEVFWSNCHKNYFEQGSLSC